MELFGSSGVRGVALSELTPELVVDVARAGASEFDADRVAVGRDVRTTGRLFADAAAAGIAAAGSDVDRLGVAPTPAVCRYCAREGVPGVVVTASHNPPAFNGVKLVGADGVELDRSAVESVERRVRESSFADADWETAGSTRRVEGVNREYVEEVLDAVDRDAVADAGLTVAVDPGNGAGGLASPAFFRRLGCRVVTVNARPDGGFPGRQPEPVAERLGDLRRLVRAAGADLGIAHDGDADRAVFVDERGEAVDGDASLAALAADALSAGEYAVAGVAVSQRLVDVCESVGAKLALTPIGATNVITRVRELRAAGERVPIAGEGNGGVFFPEAQLVRDGALIGARFLELVAERPASEVVEPYADYHTVRRDVAYDDEAEREALLDAAAEYADRAGVEPDTTDGYRLDYGDAWVLIRPSGTEPKVRVYAEARSADRASGLADSVLAVLEDAA